MKNIFWGIMVLGAIAFLALVVGPCAYYGFIDKPDSGLPDMPDKGDATHSFYIENTGGLILASDFEQHGHAAGSRLFLLHGFWEMRGSKFQFVDGDIILDEAIFGEITVKRRAK